MSPTNTLRELRVQRGLTQAELAYEAGVTRHSILRMEQLCYPNPLPNVISALSDITGTSERVLTKQYHADVVLNRALSKHLYFYDHQILWRAMWIAVEEFKLKGTHGFKAWREAVMEALGEPSSRIHFSSIVTIHPARLDKYESFKTGFADDLEVALKESGIPEELLARFKSEPSFNQIQD